jgi:hypothetical protein
MVLNVCINDTYHSRMQCTKRTFERKIRMDRLLVMLPVSFHARLSSSSLQLCRGVLCIPPKFPDVFNTLSDINQDMSGL